MASRVTETRTREQGPGITAVRLHNGGIKWTERQVSACRSVLNDFLAHWSLARWFANFATGRSVESTVPTRSGEKRLSSAVLQVA
jgi:hypothetical protein